VPAPPPGQIEILLRPGDDPLSVERALIQSAQAWPTYRIGLVGANDRDEHLETKDLVAPRKRTEWECPANGQYQAHICGILWPMTTRDRLRRHAATGLRRVARSVGQDLLTRNYYSPIPAWEDLPDEVFMRRSPLTGISYDEDAHVEFLQRLEPYLVEFEPPSGFVWDNGMYERIEADVLHAIVRAARPKRIIELGSGYSTLIIADAVRRNGLDGSQCTYSIFDPFAPNFIRARTTELDWRNESAADVALEVFRELGEDDILFVDTTHTVKLGSEVNYIVLDVLPTLAPGVLVHIHDIFLPYEYPRGFFEQKCYWAEQYLLQGFLTNNQSWEVALPLAALTKDRPADVARLVQSFRGNAGPGAFWIRRVAP
jgi:Methyltransferase domain